VPGGLLFSAMMRRMGLDIEAPGPDEPTAERH
jgi:hypothetical protein